MTPERRSENILHQFGMDQSPINVRQLAKFLGARIERTDLGEDCSGVLVRQGDSAVIGVHYAHHPNRQRFTIAHELGHLVLHDGGTYVDRGTQLRFRNAVSGSGTDLEEREANQFAAALLMPRAKVCEEFLTHPFDLGDDSALTSLAFKFGVSIQALSVRLMNLGLLSDAKR